MIYNLDKFHIGKVKSLKVFITHQNNLIINIPFYQKSANILVCIDEGKKVNNSFLKFYAAIICKNVNYTFN